MAKPLPSRPLLIPGESPASPLMRAAGVNGYSGVGMLTNVHGLCASDDDAWITAAYTRPDRYRQIATRMGLGGDIELLAFRRVGPTTQTSRKFAGVAIPESLFRPDGNTYCPQCLRERAFWRRLWLLRPVAACPEHGVYLHSQCPSCAQPLDATRGDLLRCKCGFDLRESPTESVDASPVQWLKLCIDAGDGEMVRRALEFWLRLCDFLGPDHTQADALTCLFRSQRWAEGNHAPWPDLTAVLVGRSAKVHPRLQILPFLRGDTATKTFGIAIVAAVKPTPVQDHATLEGSITSTDAALVLGLNAGQIRSIRIQGILSKASKGSEGAGSVTRASVNALLVRLDVAYNHADRGVEIARTTSLASIVQRIFAGDIASAGFDCAIGLKSLRFRPERPMPTLQPSSALNVHQVAQKLGVHPEIVRSMARKGHLRCLGPKGIRTRLLVTPAEVDRFERTYVTGGALARSLNVNPTNLSEKLKHVGLLPVAGPGIDGMLVYLFERASLSPSALKKALALNTYATATGRPAKGAHPDRGPGVSVAEASRRLGVSAQKVLSLMRVGTIETISSTSRGPKIERRSLARLERMLHNPAYVPVAECATRLGCSIRKIDTIWAAAELLTVFDLQCWRLVRRSQLEKLESLLKVHVTASQAGALLGMHRSHLPNLERRGQITSRVFGRRRKIRLYLKCDVDALVSAPQT